MANFDNKVVLITGASSGIGAASAVHFSTLGAKLALVGRNEANLQKVADDCLQKSPGSLKPLCLVTEDLTLEAEMEKVVKNTVEHFGQLDVLINSAGNWHIGGLENTSLAHLDDLYRINLRAIFYMTMLCTPHLVKTKGNIVNISSAAGTKAVPGSLAYNILKAALDHLTRTVALELAPKSVRVNAVSPGCIKTPIHPRKGFTGEAYDDLMEKMLAFHPLGRVGETDDVIHAIAFLACDEQAKFITGAILPVDAGVVLCGPSL